MKDCGRGRVVPGTAGAGDGAADRGRRGGARAASRPPRGLRAPTTQRGASKLVSLYYVTLNKCVKIHLKQQLSIIIL